ncbi:MAG: hypothetical protein ABH879_07535 [archaeon]
MSVCKGNESELKGMIKDTGAVFVLYGSYEIEISDPKNFPWAGVFDWLLSCGCEVYITRKEGRVAITTKQTW